MRFVACFGGAFTRVADRARERIELVSKKGTMGEFRCRWCDHVLEVFNGSTEVAIRLTVQPEKTFRMSVRIPDPRVS